MQVTASLDEELSLDLECLVTATMASKASLVRQALRTFIDGVVRENEGIAVRFKHERVMRKLRKHKHLRIVK